MSAETENIEKKLDALIESFGGLHASVKGLDSKMNSIDRKQEETATSHNAMLSDLSQRIGRLEASENFDPKELKNIQAAFHKVAGLITEHKKATDLIIPTNDDKIEEEHKISLQCYKDINENVLSANNKLRKQFDKLATVEESMKKIYERLGAINVNIDNSRVRR